MHELIYCCFFYFEISFFFRNSKRNNRSQDTTFLAVDRFHIIHWVHCGIHGPDGNLDVFLHGQPGVCGNVGILFIVNRSPSCITSTDTKFSFQVNGGYEYSHGTFMGNGWPFQNWLFYRQTSTKTILVVWHNSSYYRFFDTWSSRSLQNCCLQKSSERRKRKQLTSRFSKAKSLAKTV